MSVLLKGLAMPRDGERLKVWIVANGQVIVDKRTYYEEYEAVELPEHGDLVDRDALKEKAHKLPNGYNHGYFHKCVDELFDYAPVIIPAERSEDAAN